MTGEHRRPARRLSANVLLAVIPWLLPAIVAVVAVPITVRGLGADAYGIVALVGSVAGYLALMELGAARGVTRYVAMFVSLGQGRPVRECLRVVLIWSAVVGLVGGIALCVLAPWLVKDVLKVPARLTPQAIVAFRIGGASFVLGMLVSVLSVIPSSFLRYDTVAVLQTALASGSLAGPAVMVTLGYGLVPVMWFGLVLNGVALIAWAVVGHRLVRTVPDEGPPFSEYRRPFVSFVLTEAVNRVWNIVPEQTPRLIIGMVSGTAQVAYYQVSNTIAGRLNELVTRMATVLFPTMSQMAAAQEHGRILEVYKRSSRLLFMLNVSITCSVVVFADPLLKYWISPVYAVQGAAALSFLALGQLVAAASQPAGNLNRALGRPRINLAFTIVCSAVQLSVIYQLTVAYGITGTAFSWFLSAFVWLAHVHYTNRRVLNVNSWQMFRHCFLLPTLIGAAVTTIGWFALRPLATSFLATLALMGLTASAGLLLGSVAGVITPADRGSIKSALRLGKPTPTSPERALGDDDASE